MKYDSKSILKKALLFENKTLISLSNINIHHNFTRSLESFLNLFLTQENVDIWFEKNNYQLNDKLSEPWYVNYGSKTPFFHSYLGNNVWARIYKTADIPQDFNIQQSVFLQGNDSIPNLWMYIGTQEDLYGLWDLDKNLSHDVWLVLALQSLFNKKITPDFLQQVSQFYILNKNKIDDIKKSFKTKPNMIGAGSNGVAFSISNSLVLKIFKDLYSFEEAKKSINRLHKDPDFAKTEAMIYDIGHLGSFNDKNVYYLIMELMKSVIELDPSLQKKIGKIIRFIILHTNVEKESKWDKIKKNIDNPFQKNSIIKEIKLFTNQLLPFVIENNREAIKLIETSLNLKPSWLSSLIEEIISKYLTSRGDLHIGNLGITNYGELRYFDPSHENWKDSLNYED